MKRWPVVPMALAAAVFGGVQPARSQDLAAICRQAAHPPVGSWSSYQFVGGQENGATMRISVVGAESAGDTSLLWIELTMDSVGMGPGLGVRTSGVMKMLVPNFGPGMGSPRSVIIKFGGAPAMTLPLGDAFPVPQNAANGLAGCQDARSLGWENVIVPGGSFRALHVQDPDSHSDEWVVPDLPLALVKAVNDEQSGGGQMLLVGHGTGATSAITETPVPFNPQLMMQMMNPTSH